MHSSFACEQSVTTVHLICNFFSAADLEYNSFHQLFASIAQLQERLDQIKFLQLIADISDVMTSWCKRC